MHPTLAAAERRVLDAREAIKKQRHLISQVKAANGACGLEQKILSSFERSLVIFEVDLANMEIEVRTVRNLRPAV